MKYVAYKTALNNPNLPNGFITDHFETDQETVDGYVVVTLDSFNQLFKNNVALIRQSEASRKIVTVHPDTPAPVLRHASEAEHVPNDVSPPTQDQANAELFNQFLAWMTANKANPPSNT